MNITLRKLLQDPLYKKWFAKIPQETSVGTFPWRVWVLTKKGWTKPKHDFKTYREAYNWIVPRINDYQDLVLYSKGHEFKPPIIKYRGKRYYWPTPPGYNWCGYCRRPTAFSMFSHHHALTHIADPMAFRCTICGARKKFQKQFESNLPASYYDRELAPKGTPGGTSK
ncbi:MAG: hypothetical protein DMF62_04620 [Acidobacteria bacterium]|nr:MAG: hypothetical protein DMF62_04620 [Acidobacteriota bacterium]